LSDFVQIEVVCDDLAFVQLRQLDELEIDFPDCREVILHDLNLQICYLLEALQDVEAATPAVSFEGIGRVSDQLQLTQHELRSHDDAVEKASLGNIGDSAIDDHAGVQDLVALLGLLLAAKNSA